MKFKYSKEYLSGHEKFLQRFFELLPGLTSWTLLLGTAFLAITQPAIAAVLMIAFYLYWLFRLLYMTIFLGISYYRLKIENRTDWMSRARGIDNLEDYIDSLKRNSQGLNLHKRISRYIHRNELTNLRKEGNRPPLSNDIYQLVIYPVVRESGEIIEPGIQSLSQQDFPTERMLVVFALEERAAQDIKDTVYNLEKKYKNSFWDVLTVVHPSHIAGEAKVKGANVTCAAKEAARYLQEKSISFENVIVSCFDADTVVSPQYFSCLTYYFMITAQRLKSSFQPIPVYHNNIWDVPGFARVIEAGSSFFQLVEATNPEKLVTFSSHSMSFQALVDSGYWPVDMISDDSAIYWKCLIHFDGQYSTVPMYVTLSMDIAGSNRFWETAKSVYKQKRRWAWGVENFPLVMRAFLKNKKISLYNKIRYCFKLFEGHISWATWGFLLSFIGWLPAFFASESFISSVVYYNAPRIRRTIFHLAILSLIVSIIISISLLPKKKLAHPWRRRIIHAAEWLMVPVILIVFSSLPSLEAQTRLMLGKYMEFWVTEKKRKK